MHNVLDAAPNTVVSFASKAEDNNLHIMIALVFVLYPTTLPNPVANPLHDLLRALKDVVIKQVQMLSGKLKAAKPWPEIA